MKLKVPFERLCAVCGKPEPNPRHLGQQAHSFFDHATPEQLENLRAASRALEGMRNVQEKYDNKIEPDKFG